MGIKRCDNGLCLEERRKKRLEKGGLAMILGIFLVGVMVGMAVTATAIFALREVR